MKTALNPAMSYDFGLHIWSIGCSLGGITSKNIQSYHGLPLDHTTAQLGFDTIERKFNADLNNFPRSTSNVQP